MADINSLKNSNQRLAELRSRSGSEEVARKNNNMLFQVKQEQRSSNFGALSQLLATGNSLYSLYKDSSSLNEFAQGEGFDIVGSRFNKIFGNVKFQANGKTFNRQDMLALKAYRDYSKQKSMFDIFSEAK